MTDKEPLVVSPAVLEDIKKHIEAGDTDIIIRVENRDIKVLDVKQ